MPLIFMAWSKPASDMIAPETKIEIRFPANPIVVTTPLNALLGLLLAFPLIVES